MNTNELIGSRIKAALKHRRKTQKELALQIDIPVVIIKGHRAIPAEILVDIVKCLNVNMHYLIGFDDNDEGYEPWNRRANE